jgi:quercetin dioxygenase-like cupin family protein
MSAIAAAVRIGGFFVIAGTGTALVKKKRYRLVAGSLLFIARGERHETRNGGE